jgi:subfamily B ATP-binding cassette protein MsbA
MNFFLPALGSNLRALNFPQRWFFIYVGIQLGAVLFEGIGIGMLLPILEYLSSATTEGASPPSGRIWELLETVLSIINVKPTLVSLLSLCFAAIMARQLFFFAREMFVGYVEFELSRQIRNTAFERFVHARLNYHDRLEGGNFVNELTSELQGALTAVQSAMNFIGYSILLAGYAVVAIGLSPLLSAGALVVFAVSGVFLSFLFRRMRGISVRYTESNQNLLTFLVERLKNVRLIRLAGVEGAEVKLLRDFTRKQRDIAFERRRVFASMTVAIEPVILLAAFALLYLSIEFVGLELERTLLFFFILIRLVPVVKDVVASRQGYIGFSGSVDVVVKRLNELAEEKDVDTGDRPLTTIETGIFFRDVTFAYESRKDGSESDGGPEGRADGAKALHGVTLTIPAGKMTAIVGPSGAGKSTLIDLLPRLRRPDSGHITVDGAALDSFSTESLRQAISFAPQQPQMFNVSVAEHIRYGFRKATQEQVEQAAKLANAYDFIMALPDGFDTMLGENGNRLSGGQRQRLDLARALVRQAPLLIMDEPTSSLDAESEALFRAALKKIRDHTDITIVLIGHNLMTTANADQIVVLRAGKVDSSGQHAALLKECDWYANAFNGRIAGDQVNAL